MAKQGVMHGIAVGGCCELSTSAHHLIARIGEGQGYRLAESSGMDIEDSITIATRLLKGRIAKQVWCNGPTAAQAPKGGPEALGAGSQAVQARLPDAGSRDELPGAKSRNASSWKKPRTSFPLRSSRSET